eukprot:3168010-Pyramimonas_sp.AAC.1
MLIVCAISGAASQDALPNSTNSSSDEASSAPSRLQTAPNTIADIMCSGLGSAKVAIVIVGRTRTFASPLVYRSIKENVLSAFGGQQVLFTYLVNRIEEGGSTSSRFAPYTAIISILRYYHAALS